MNKKIPFSILCKIRDTTASKKDEDDIVQWLTEVESDEEQDMNAGTDEGQSNTRTPYHFTEVESDEEEREMPRSSTPVSPYTRVTEVDTDQDSDGDSPAKQHVLKRVRFQDVLDESESDDDEDYATTVHKGASRIQPVVAALQSRCCGKYCVRHISVASANNARLSFTNRSGQEQRQWVLDYLSDHHQATKGAIEYQFLIGTTRVCSSGWRNICGITKTRFYQIKKRFEAGCRYALPPNALRKGAVSLKATCSVTWLERYASRYGDKLPDSNKVHLPSCLTKDEVYNMMRADLTELGQEFCKSTTFFRLWRRDLKHIAIPKENRFAKCDKCTVIKSALEETMDKAVRKELYAKRHRHISLQNGERRKYYKHVQKARNFSDLYMSIIIDGMDQKSTSLPSFLVTPKSFSSMWKLPTHITGVIVHGRGHHNFIDFKELPHDSNLTVNVLLLVLQKYPMLPPTLYLQLDNCGRENKNKFVFSLCCLLVELQIFKKIKVSFLMVGHTHEDIDQMFSRISVCMWRHKVHTLSRLLQLIPEAYQKPNTTAERLVDAANFRDWVSPCLNPVCDHSKPHVFKFTRDETGKAVLETKNWSSTGEAWSPCLRTQNVSPYLLLKHPDGQPEAVKKDFTSLKLETLKKDVNRTTGHLSEAELQEWSNLFCELDEESKPKDTSVDFVLHDILANVVQKKQTEEVSRTLPSGQDVNVSEDDLQPRQVRLGKRPPTAKVPPEVKEGRMVATHLHEYNNEWPQIGEVLCVKEETVDVHWYTGTYTRKWSPLNIRVRGKKSKQAWKTSIPKSSILGYSFELTKANKLPGEVVRFLKEKYEEIYS